MADSTERGTDVRYLGFLAMTLIALIAGLVIHTFIIGVNVTDWWKGRSVTPVDLIVTSLGMSRMCTQCVNILFFFVHPLFLRNLDLNIIITLGYYFFTYANIWLTSLLSVVFCLKISNLHSRLFLYLRGVIVPRTVYLIGAAVLLSAVCSLIIALLAVTKVINGEAYNTTMTNSRTYCIDVEHVYFATIGSFFPMLFSYISSVLLFTSLYHHTTKMKMSSNLPINLETYYSMMKFVSFNSIYNTVYFICYFSCMLYYYFYCVSLVWLYIILGFLPVIHSSYLIHRIAKLRSQMSKVLQDITNVLFQRKERETRENIEVVAL